MQSVHDLLEREALEASSAVFVYDTTPTAPFGASLIRDKGNNDVEVFQMQTRAGAGSSLVGFVESVAFSSKGAQVNEGDRESEDASSVPSKRRTRSRSDSVKKARTGVATADKPVTVLAGSSSLLSLVPSLLSLPASTVRPAVTIQVSAQASSLATDVEGSVTLIQVPELGAVLDASKSLTDSDWNGSIILSETAEDAAFVGTQLAKSINATGHDLINVFDGATVGRELSQLENAALASSGEASLEAVLASNIEPFSYTGSATATNVLVLPASVYSANAKAAVAAVDAQDVGVLAVRVVKPWNAKALLAALPSSVKTLHLYSEQENSTTVYFREEILSTLLSAGSPVKLRKLPISTVSVPDVAQWTSILANVSPAVANATVKPLLAESAKLAVFWDLDGTSGQTEKVPATLASTFAQDASVAVKLLTQYDNFRQGGIQQSTLLLAPKGKQNKEFSLSALAETSPASLLFLSSPVAVLKAYEAISDHSIGPQTRIVISANWTAEEVGEKLPYAARKALVKAGGKDNLFVIDADAIAKSKGVRAADVAEIVFWTLYLPSTLSAKEIVALLERNSTFSGWDHAKVVEINSIVRNAITSVDVQQVWADEPMAEDGKPAIPASLPTSLLATAAGPNADRTFAEPTPEVIGESPKKSWHQLAHRLLFPEAFQLETSEQEKKRPDLPEETFLITVTENRRLTPSTYDRNVFHLEFSTEGTGLKYAVGEALGIHGWNDADEVQEFLQWYGLDPNAVISMPSRLDPSRVEQRTAFQVFQQNLDLFGKPGKQFYETLSRYAKDKNEERTLRFIACADGHATFKKFSEMDTVTYADLLKLFPSAKIPLEELVREIEEIHPRHYSISSSQNYVGDSVHLLVVTVEWDTPQGRKRYGQCTRYLAGLKAGDKVMASIKPSVMKLPPLDSQPIIMAGLGTGAAPFRAFIQERAYQREQGRDIGPSLYYFGSRHRSEEYLYGEEIEAYLQDGVVTKTGLAFSRDTSKKVYIQHKMNEDADLLAKMLDNGAFYLCGPTWPVPDVYAALISAFMKNGKTREQAEKHIEDLKEDERYVLEVY
ncbi:sulfite reductase [NADPH] flavoprotein component [Microbotryomycetes sp. JL221]|nr:sulfite reductase [NADPH] flavoprotein component [Microbotryomycetes sp. JL221]